jgi:prolipoprotein diacylglyceryl transferase
VLLASIPSPGENVLRLGPLEIHYYGILIAIGVAVAATVTRRRFEARGGEGELLERIVVWAVGLGFLGARLGYVATNTDRFFGADATLEPWQMIAIWEGGLALFGGLLAGTLTAWWFLRDTQPGFVAFVDSAAVGVPAAQAIGRWGNWFNQELFGTPSSLPWAVEIDPGRRPAAFADSPTFHPTFLYESLWNILIVVLLLQLEKRRVLRRPGSLAMAYFGLYGLGRFLTELLRTDTTFRILGLSRNGWISVLLVVVMGVLLARRELDPAIREEAPNDEEPTALVGEPDDEA